MNDLFLEASLHMDMVCATVRGQEDMILITGQAHCLILTRLLEFKMGRSPVCSFILYLISQKILSE